LSYLELVEPYQITIWDAQDHLSLLRFGEAPRWSEDDAMSAFGLKRVIESTRTARYGGPAVVCADQLIAPQGLENNVVRDVIDALREYVERTSQDSAGRGALARIERFALAYVEKAHLRCSRWRRSPPRAGPSRGPQRKIGLLRRAQPDSVTPRPLAPRY